MSKSPQPGLTGKRVIIAARCGRLANRLVLFANGIAFAEEYGHRLINFTFHTYADQFASLRDNFYCAYPRPPARSRWDKFFRLGRLLRRWRLAYNFLRNLSRLNERLPFFITRAVTLRPFPGKAATYLDDPKILERIRPARTVFIYGWPFRVPHLVQRHAEKIRAFFHPLEPIASASRAAVKPLRQQAEVVVGVHIRQGDYRTWRQGRLFFSPAQYAAWMREMMALFPGRRVAFLVVSDEPRRAEEFSGLTVGFGPGTPVADMYALAECDYILGPVSTYSQWASFQGNKPLLLLDENVPRLRLEDFAVSDLAIIP